MRTEAILHARGVSYAYNGAPVLESVSLELHHGEFVALVGPNGSGKSTLLRVLLGLLPPRTGEVRLFGEDPQRLSDWWRVGYVPQRPTLAADLPATVEEVVMAGRLARRGWWRWPSASDRQAVDHELAAVGLEHLRHRRSSELSAGQQQRAFIAKALASSPELLVLDEPVAGVDSQSQRLFRTSVTHLVRDHEASVLLVSHELGAVADDLDRVVVLKNRIIFDGTPKELAAEGVSLGVHAQDLPLWLEDLA
jgi:zinc transport system ATP-binding protein